MWIIPWDIIYTPMFYVIMLVLVVGSLGAILHIIRKKNGRIRRLCTQANLSPLMVHNVLHDARVRAELWRMGKNEAAILEYLRKYKGQKEHKQPTAPPPSTSPEKPQATIHSKEVIERQVVVVRCQYCNNLYPVETLKCPRCGGQ